jgi:hypothetical protein
LPLAEGMVIIAVMAILTYILALLAVLPPLGAEELVTGRVRTRVGGSLEGVEVRFYRRVGPGWERRSLVTGADGSFSIQLPRDRWAVVTDDDDLLARGHFCVPMMWMIDDEWVCSAPFQDLPPSEVPVNVGPITCERWGEPLDLVAIPTEPALRILPEAGVDIRQPSVGILVAYPFARTQRQLFAPRYHLQRSTDLNSWTTMQTVTLDGQGGTLILDPTSRTGECFYRTVFADMVALAR